MMMASDHTMGKWPSNHWFSQIIFRPMNTSTPASPYFNSENCITAAASTKYNDRRPRIAKTLDV